MHALILCNGAPPPVGLFQGCYKNANLFIAADGGGNVARLLGAEPDVVIGDLDSYQHVEGSSAEIIRDPDQERNDLEKALDLAIQRDVTHAMVLGGTGLRLDHTLKNLSVLKQFNDRFQELRFRDSFGDLFLLPGRYSDELPLGTPVSLFPLSGRVTGITTAGLRYPLDNETLENGIRDGSSNEITASPFEIYHKAGDLLFFIAANLPPNDC